MATKPKAKKRELTGTIYSLHFNQRYRHAGHYLGFATDLKNRLDEHAAGCGARLMQVVINIGIKFECVRTWTGTRSFERQLKNRRDARSLCPHCRAERKAEKRHWYKTRRQNEQ